MGLIVGLVLGGVVLLVVLLAVLGVVLGSNSDSTTSEPDTTATGPDGPATTVPGTGPRASLTSAQAATLLKRNQAKGAPGLSVRNEACPAGPYRIGQRMICTVQVEDSVPLLYEVEVTGDLEVNITGTSPVIDTFKAVGLIESNDPGSVADCGTPRVRQLEVGATFPCSTPTSTWDVTVTSKDGKITAMQR